MSGMTAQAGQRGVGCVGDLLRLIMAFRTLAGAAALGIHKTCCRQHPGEDRHQQASAHHPQDPGHTVYRGALELDKDCITVSFTRFWSTTCK